LVNKSSLAKKLASYSAVAAAVLAIDRTADAQIVYTPVKPAFVGSDTTYNLDLNNDGIVDFKIIQTHTSFRNGGTNYSFSAHGGEFVGAIAMSSNALIGKPFYYGSAINANNVGSYGWAKGQSFEYEKWQLRGNDDSSFYSGGPWRFNSDTSYVPLKLVDNGNTYYGWVRLYIGGSFIVTGYAYNSVPDSGIYAGQECNIQFPIPTISQNGAILTTTAATKIQWYYNDKAISGDTTQSISVSQNGIYTVTTGDTTICHGTSLPFNYINCSTLQLPVIVSSGNLICNYKVVKLSMDSVPQYYSIQWLKNDTILPGEANKTFYTSIGGSYSIVWTEQGGCTDTSTSVKITLDTNLIYPSIIQSNDTLFFVPYQGNFPANTKLQWYTLDSTINGANAAYYVPNDTGIYKLTETDSIGCSETTDFGYQVCKNIHPFITSTTKAVCNYNWMSLYADSVPSDYRIEWFFNNVLNDNGQKFQVWKPGSIYAVIYETGGCSDTTNTINLPLDTTHYHPVITQHDDTLFSNYSTGNTWLSEITNLTNDSAQFFLPPQSGYYYIIYTDSLGCTTSSTEYYYSYTKTGIKNSNSIESISIYPNPAKDQLLITSNNLQIMQVQIENELGQIVLDKVFDNPLKKQTLDINTLPAGMYFYRITTKDEETITGKFVKE